MNQPATAKPTSATLGYPLAVSAGIITAIQSRVNGGLADYLGSGLNAALINFTIGLLIVSTLVVLVPRSRAGVVTVYQALRSKALPWWALIGGVFGAFFIAIQSTSVPVIGVALFSVALVAGQTVSSLLVDRLGIGSHTAMPVTTARIVGTAMAVIAVFIAVSDQWSSQEGGFWLLIGLSFLAGLLVALQQAVNGKVAMMAKSAPAATLGNFIVGALTLASVVAISGTTVGNVGTIDFSGPGWAYLGGVLGVAFIGIAAFTVPILGVLSFALAVIAGQLAGAIALDLIWPATAHPVTLAVLAGAALAALAAFVGRRRSS